MITAGGYREPITLQQIRTNMEMESHEENLHNMIKISKMETAKDQARDAARTIRDRQMRGGPTGIGGGANESPGECHVTPLMRHYARVSTELTVLSQSNSIKCSFN